MSIGFFNVPTPKNEPILGYAPNSKERVSLKSKLAEMKSQVIEVPMFIGSEELKEGNKLPLTSPHDHQHVLGYYYEGDASHVNKAIDTALAAREKWANMSWEHRVSIFLKAADLSASKYRMELNAATMLGQSKNAFQAGDYPAHERTCQGLTGGCLRASGLSERKPQRAQQLPRCRLRTA